MIVFNFLLLTKFRLSAVVCIWTFWLKFCACNLQHNQDLILASNMYPMFFSCYYILRNSLGQYCLFASSFKENQYSAFSQTTRLVFLSQHRTSMIQKFHKKLRFALLCSQFSCIVIYLMNKHTLYVWRALPKRTIDQNKATVHLLASLNRLEYLSFSCAFDNMWISDWSTLTCK